MNDSKKKDPRFWKKWEASGAVNSIDKAVEEAEPKALSTDSMSDKLRNLGQYMPVQDNLICEFGSYLADRLNPELVPAGFNMAAELLLYDLRTGVDGYSGEPIRSSLVGNPPVIYAILRAIVPKIAEAVCPPDFAKGVKDFHEKVNEKMRE